VAQPDGRLILVGMMGAGKSTIGRALAAALGLAFLDADAEIERRTGVRVATLFSVEGEEAFRDRESALLQELCASPRPMVLATGGGAVVRAANRVLLRKSGFVVFLDAPAAEIERRTRFDTSRPLLAGPDRRARIDELLAQRLPLYRETAHLTVRSPARNPRRLVEALLTHPAVAACAAPGAAGAGDT
jgi:shikimate kinase